MPFSYLVFLLPVSYQALVLCAGLCQIWKRRRKSAETGSSPYSRPGVSVLKPLRGLDPNTEQAFVSQIEQNYPAFEVLFGVRDEKDPAVAAVRKLQRQHPSAPVKLLIGSADSPNSKVGVLIALSRHAQYPVWVVNDSDIRVDPDYLSRVVSPLRDSSVGLVTCPYRAEAHTVPAAWESLGISTDFMPSTFVAQLLGVREFGLGSTLAFRSSDLEQAGGFAAIADYLADDFQLAKRITGLGKRALLSSYVVETSLGEDSWRGVWRHQVRWARTIRASKGWGFAGLPVTHAGVWISVALSVGAWTVAGTLLAIRLVSAFLFGHFVLRHRFAARFFWLSPVWDLYAFAIWLVSYQGRTVRWRDKSLEIDRQGRIRT